MSLGYSIENDERSEGGTAESNIRRLSNVSVNGWDQCYSTKLSDSNKINLNQQMT